MLVSSSLGFIDVDLVADIFRVISVFDRMIVLAKLTWSFFLLIDIFIY